MNVLIVDDSDAQIVIMSKIVQHVNEQVKLFSATDGEKALALCDQEKIEVIFSDWNMPNLNGLELLSKLKNQNYNAKFYFVTSNQTARFVEQAKGAGADGFFSKPFVPLELVDELKKSGILAD